MTKSREGGENEFTREAKREAARTGMHVCEILAEMLDDLRTRNQVIFAEGLTWSLPKRDVRDAYIAGLADLLPADAEVSGNGACGS